jgi:hypothetical protein
VKVKSQKLKVKIGNSKTVLIHSFELREFLTQRCGLKLIPHITVVVNREEGRVAAPKLLLEPPHRTGVLNMGKNISPLSVRENCLLTPLNYS